MVGVRQTQDLNSLNSHINDKKVHTPSEVHDVLQNISFVGTKLMHACTQAYRRPCVFLTFDLYLEVVVES